MRFGWPPQGGYVDRRVSSEPRSLHEGRRPPHRPYNGHRGGCLLRLGCNAQGPCLLRSPGKEVAHGPAGEYLPTGKAVRALFARNSRIRVCIANSGVFYADVKKGELPEFTALTGSPAMIRQASPFKAADWLSSDKACRHLSSWDTSGSSASSLSP